MSAKSPDNPHGAVSHRSRRKDEEVQTAAMTEMNAITIRTLKTERENEPR